MSNAAHQIAIKSVPATVTDTTPDYLTLTGNLPFSVGVSYDIANDKPIFSWNGQTGYNLRWQTQGYGLVINLSWDNQDNPITEFLADTPSCWFTDAATSNQGSTTDYAQTGCVPPLPGSYHFTNNLGHDPVIIVTPIQT